MGMKGKAVKPSACWFWKPSQNLSNKGPSNNSVSVMFKKYTYIDTQGRLNVSQICDNKNNVLFTDSECIVLGRDFKLLDDANILLRTPRQHNMYSIDLNNIVPRKDLTCLVAKASADECMLWHRRLVIDDFSRFTWTFFLKSKDETGGTLKKFITEIENLKSLKVKIIRVLVNKYHNKNPYELFNGRSPAIGFLKPFGCHVMILNTLDNLGKFEEKGDEAKKDVSSLRYIALPNWAHDALLEYSSSKPQDHCSTKVPEGSGNTNPTASTSNPPADQMETLIVKSPIPTVSSPVLTACFTDSPEPSSDARHISKRVSNQVETPSLDNILTLANRFEDILGATTNTNESNGVEADIRNIETTIIASPTPTLRIHKDHPKSQIIGPLDTPIQTRNKSKEMEEQSFIATIHQKTDQALLQFCLFSCFLSQVEPKKIFDALQDLSWNKKDERGIVIRNKARLVAQGHTQEEGIDYDEVFAPVARIEAIKLFLAYASFMGFTVYQLDVKSAFLYGTIDEEGKDGSRKDVDLHLYRSMIGSLMYHTASRPDIMFAVCAGARHQVTHKECHLHAIKRIFRYLKGHPKMGLWYPKESPFDLLAYSDSDYGGAIQDRKSTTEGC
nr:hypothetical protein [Tanacetum cinerariifolium]